MDKHPKSGIISVIFPSIPLLMFLVDLNHGLLVGDLFGNSAYNIGGVTILLSFPCAIIGIVSGFIGLRHPKKILPKIGLVLGALSILIGSAYFINMLFTLHVF